METLLKSLLRCSVCGRDITPASYLLQGFDLLSMTCEKCYAKIRGAHCIGKYDGSRECRLICIDRERCKKDKELEMLVRGITDEIRRRGMDMLVDRRIQKYKRKTVRTAEEEPHPYKEGTVAHKAFELAQRPQGLDLATLRALAVEHGYSDRVKNVTLQLRKQHSRGWRWDLMYEEFPGHELVGKSYVITNLRRITQ